MQSSEQFPEATHVAILGGEKVYFTTESFTAVCDTLRDKYNGAPVVKKVSNGNGKPVVPTTGLVVTSTEPEPEPAPEPEPTQVSSQPPEVLSHYENQYGKADSDDDSDGVSCQVSQTGKARSAADYEALIAAGFAPAQPLFERGTRVIQYGKDEARRVRQEFDDMDKVHDYCSDFAERIEDENRRTDVHGINELRILKNGDLRLPDGQRISIDMHAFGQLCRRAGPELGSGVSYLQQCWPDMRARDVNNWLKHYGNHLAAQQSEYDDEAVGVDPKRVRKILGRKRPEELTAKLLLRDNDKHQSNTECFGLVSKLYADQFHVGTIAEGIMRSKGISNARGTVVYNGRRARFQALYHTTTKPDHFVAGEFFRVGIQIKTDDTGSGSCQIDAVAFQNLCLNLIIIDRAVTRIENIKHMGDSAVLAKKFDEAMERAVESLDHFVKQWGYAVEEDVLQRTADVTPDHAAELLKAHNGAVPISVALPGLFNGLFTHNRELALVPAGRPNSPRRQELIGGLVRAYDQDQSSAKQGGVPVSRASIANALTRYAHEGQNDPWMEDVFQRSAGNLLTPRVRPTKANPNPMPPPIPYVPFDLKQLSA